MEILIALFSAAFALFLAIIPNVLASDLYDRFPRISKWTISLAVKLLPEDRRLRFEEEWMSHLDECDTKLGQILHSVGCLISAIVLSKRDRTSDFVVDTNTVSKLLEANVALRQTEQLRSDFIHHVSYELRSPLTNIIGFTQLLGDGSIGPLNKKQTEYLGYMMRSSATLLAIINDILDLATIDSQALVLERQRIDIVDIISEAAEGVQDRVAEANLELHIMVSPGIGSFLADRRRVRQVLYNLLSNAVGFSCPGQTITLSVFRKTGDVHFMVSDQGRGIPADVLPHVFDRFHSNTSGTRHRGIGLGLSIVKSFVELHGGQVLIDTATFKGTTVTCIFPEN